MEINDVDVFNNWILPIIKPICLADPESLARYVVVLLKKSNPKPDLRSYCIQNLSIFIDNSKIKVEDFVDMVLDAVENKKYYPASEQVAGKEPNSTKQQQQQVQRHDKNRPPSRHAKSRSRSPVSSKHYDEHTSRKSRTDEGNNSDTRKGRSDTKRSRSRSRSDRETRSRSPHSRSTRGPAVSASENEDRTSKKAGSHNICPTFEQQGYCLNGDSCTYTHPGSLPVEEKDIQAIAATYQAAASTQLFQGDPAGGFAAPKPSDFTQQVMNVSPRNAHISPVLASYLQFGFQQIAAAAAVNPMQSQFLQAPQDPNAMFAQQFAGAHQQVKQPDVMVASDDQQQAVSVPVVVSSRQGGFGRRQDMGNLRQFRRNEFGGGGPPRKFDNRFGGERPLISASQLDNEMEEIAQANAAARNLDPANEPPQDNTGSFAAVQGNNPNDPASLGKNFGPGSGYANRPFRGRGGGRGFHQRGGRMPRGAGGMGRGHPADMSNNILEVRKIPANLNSIGPLHEHFSTFGPVVNIQVNFEGDPEAACVTFANHTDALGAYRSPNPLFNNRFIRLFWHHKEPQQEQGSADQPKPEGARPGPEMEQQTAKTELQSQGQQPQPQQQQQQGPTAPKVPRAKLRIDHVGDEKAKVTEAQNDLAKRRRLLLANYLEMRKTLAEKSKAAASETANAEVNATLKTIDEKINALKAELGLVQKAKTTPQGQQSGGDSAGATSDAAKTPQKLGRESFTVDRRPKQLLVSSVAGLDAASLRSHFGLFCSVDGVEVSSNGFVVTFSSRKDAEIAKARGLVFRGQQVSINWHQPLFYSQPAVKNEQQPQQVSTDAKSNQAESGKTLFDDADSEDERQQQGVETS